ncbi:hypothetical protein SKAU_G00425680 [Synaphobranchus kaupii]|uniref:PurE domain-containing protein n=1 Tax=Synaphobranchus kaupii TaxID=118154 RepID=A0A9Q1E5D3_SYNKA|nr:hypothetical protein SKAU_G00425680 [Synaphobranchus kaupii]
MASIPVPADTTAPQLQEGEEPSTTNQGERRHFKATIRPAPVRFERRGGSCSPGVEAEVRKYWTDEEVHALLHTWADRREELRSAARNKSIFLEMSGRLQRLGVERSWRQCRTKYKNLKYDYKNARSSRNKRMKFYSQVDAIEQGRDLRGTGRGPERDQATPIKQGNPAPLYWSPARRCAGGADGGRNWKEEEVQALIAIWGEEPVRKKLENATRNRDIFQHISLQLQQHGVKRDWKQCRTKYKNLKHVYHTLRRTTPGHAHPTNAPAFYREVDAILGKGAMEQTPPSHLQKEELEHCSMPITCTGTPNSGPERPLKREASDGEWSVPSKRGLHKLDKDTESVDCSALEIVDFQCKEEPGQYIPIIQINSVHSTDPSVPLAQKHEHRPSTEMASASELKTGKKLNEGKTKEIYELPDQSGHVLVQSKDQITAGNAVRKDQMEGKAAIANKTASCVFRLLQEAGIKTAFVKQHSDTAFVAAHCEMIPIEWVCRRVATGSFLKRNPGVKEGYRFSPLKIEMFFKDDANNDPQWSEEQLLEAKFCFSGLNIGRCETDVMSHSTVAIFEILERAWATQNCTLVDMKIEFGVNVVTKEVVLADVIDNDSWRLWPAGDRSQQKDKQVYRDLKEVTPEAMQMVKRNFEWVSERVELLLVPQAQGRVVVLMGSVSDLAHCERIRAACSAYGVPCSLRVTSAHKGPDQTLSIKAQYEGDGIPTVFVAAAGRSNGLGPVMSGNTVYPVINCPPLTPDWGAQDVWSSLRMPSGLGCSTVLSPEAAAQFAAQVFGLGDHLVWSKLRASMLNTWVSLKYADQKLQACSL